MPLLLVMALRGLIALRTRRPLTMRRSVTTASRPKVKMLPATMRESIMLGRWDMYCLTVKAVILRSISIAASGASVFASLGQPIAHMSRSGDHRGTSVEEREGVTPCK